MKFNFLFVTGKDRVPSIGIQYLLYILTCVWVLHTPNVGPNMLIHIFSMKNVKEKKEGKMKQNMAEIRAFIL